MLMVVPLSKRLCNEWVKHKHYRRTLGIFWEGFGLIQDGRIVGVCTFGQPSAPIQKHAFKDRDFRLYELTRLVVQTETKNAASFLIAAALRRLKERPAAVISYADSSVGHCGIVYQATNWLYTGAVTAHDKLYIVGGEKLHPTTVRDRYGTTSPAKWARENGIETVKPEPKHRYFQFLGSKTQRRHMLSKLAYPVLQAYPKTAYTRYDDGPILDMEYSSD